MGIREWAGSGFDVYGGGDEAYDVLQHYKLPTKKGKVKEKTLSLHKREGGLRLGDTNKK